VSLTFVLVGHAQPAGGPLGAVQGTVSNAVSGSPLGRAKVAIRSTAQETLTDDDGRFYFRGAPAKDIELEVSYLGFVAQTSRVTVPPGGQVAQDFQLSREGIDRRGAEAKTIVLEKFQVVAEQTMSGQAVAMNEQRHAANIKNVVSFDELGDRGHDRREPGDGAWAQVVAMGEPAGHHDGVGESWNQRQNLQQTLRSIQLALQLQLSL
jgi:hypothetical protein